MAKHATHKDDRAYLTKGDYRKRRNRERKALARAIAPARTARLGVAR